MSEIVEDAFGCENACVKLPKEVGEEIFSETHTVAHKPTSDQYTEGGSGQLRRHTQPHTGKYTHQSCPCFKKLYKVLTVLRAISQQTHTLNVIILYEVKRSLYVVGQF